MCPYVDGGGVPEEPRMSVEDTANWLFDWKCPISRYEGVQKHRMKRLRYWEQEQLTILIREEKRLIEHGEQVLAELKRLYGQINKSTL